MNLYLALNAPSQCFAWNTRHGAPRGIYNAHLLAYLYHLHFPIWLENSLQIKRAGGLQRGKTDTIDAVRIAEYAYRFKDKIRLWQPPRQVVQQLAALSAVRQRLLLARQQLQQPLQEQQGFVTPALQKQLTKTCRVGVPTDIIESN